MSDEKYDTLSGYTAVRSVQRLELYSPIEDESGITPPSNVISKSPTMLIVSWYRLLNVDTSPVYSNRYTRVVVISRCFFSTNTVNNIIPYMRGLIRILFYDINL